MSEPNDIVADLRGWWNTDHEPDERGFCKVCSLRMPCDWVQVVDDCITAADELERLQAENDALCHAALDALALLPPWRVRLLRPPTTAMWGDLNEWRDAREAETDE